MSSFAEQAQKAIPSEFHMISGSRDSQTSADVSNVGNFSLPDPAGRAGGACTSALLKILYRRQEMSWVALLREMRKILQSMGFSQIPQLTSSRMIDVNKTMYIVPPGSNGTKRAVLIGINYTGQQGALSGCHNDLKNIKEYLKDVQGFEESDCLVLMDDNRHHNPTKQNIMNAFKRITEYANAGDVVFVHYSGHGGRLRDQDGDEDDGYDETLIPVDFRQAGQIRDDDILKVLVRPMRAGVTTTVLVDACHSGTVLDLPYRFGADDSEMRPDNGVNMGKLLGSPEAVVGILVCLYCCLGGMDF
uniref:Peptidase C14 caspase domain-containing protein n=1 Tax=Grammatophora oceanica TaxID=210454 RepID=A0A7S1VWZ7_9STRA|mmetsp:Transcript_9213/g.13443  ORF Transcript_9213/g.13443 Transcript_9213/m.13443 type:complete len:303 (+) Transcript_9213:286-1194(+)|eukprot:CAMPEP_0194030420 /NCGR_PEP_ID=MMETSP0009_2-20130614/3914_1 /TAXON_ID=210454 /ORGANISM="Grammatophora oceanica, Strain CCMP 410" /LENGTH=302 /DNA_ID=CAMNT_0038670367 /DNA_START=286 /DNA_END=1194 /DNA_ORIENTATION=-